MTENLASRNVAVFRRCFCVHVSHFGAACSLSHETSLTAVVEFLIVIREFASTDQLVASILHVFVFVDHFVRTISGADR